MNQIPNIEEVKEIRKTITNALDKHEYIASWIDIGIERICDIYEQTLHHQLQKAREEERERIKKFMRKLREERNIFSARTGDMFIEEVITALNQAELDQPNNT